MRERERIKEEFLVECRTDYEGLWALLWRVKRNMLIEDSHEIREVVLSILKDLLNSGLIKAGVPTITGRFEEWCLSPSQIMEKINCEWDRLGGEPNIGDIVWFTSPENISH